MAEFANTFLLLKKSLSENTRIRNLYIDTFSSFEYDYFLEDLLGKKEREWSWAPSDVSKEILKKDLIPFSAPIKEFEIKMSSSSFMEFLPDLKFAFSYKKEYKDIHFRFKSNGQISFTCYEKEDIFGNTVLATYCPRENFYNLLTVMTLITAAVVYDKNNLELIKKNFKESCFYFILAEKIEKNLPEIKRIYRALGKRVDGNFSWQQKKMSFINIVDTLNFSNIYSAKNFPRKDFVTRYSFGINEYNEELEFNFRELEELTNGKCFYHNLNKEINLEIPEFIGIYPNKNKLNPYKVFLRYNSLRGKIKETAILEYNLESKSLELGKNQNIGEELEKRTAIFIKSELAKDFVEKVGEKLLSFYSLAKTKNEDIFVPVKDYLVLLKKVLMDSCKVMLLISKF